MRNTIEKEVETISEDLWKEWSQTAREICESSDLMKPSEELAAVTKNN